MHTVPILLWFVIVWGQSILYIHVPHRFARSICKQSSLLIYYKCRRDTIWLLYNCRWMITTWLISRNSPWQKWLPGVRITTVQGSDLEQSSWSYQWPTRLCRKHVSVMSIVSVDDPALPDLYMYKHNDDWVRVLYKRGVRSWRLPNVSYTCIWVMPLPILDFIYFRGVIPQVKIDDFPFW